jgi:hypothetical protein
MADRRPRHTHHQAHVCAKSVVRTQYCGAQRIATDGAMPPLETGEKSAVQPARLSTNQIAEH